MWAVLLEVTPEWGENPYTVLQGSEEKLCHCVFARSHVIGCVCLLTESLNQGQAPRGMPWDHLSHPVTLKPSCMTECLESLLKNWFLGSTQGKLNQNHRNMYLLTITFPSDSHTSPQTSPWWLLYLLPWTLKSSLWNVTLKKSLWNLMSQIRI